MANALAIAAVSQVLQHLLQAGATRDDLEMFLDREVRVTVQPPGDDGQLARINLFMYHALESAHARSAGAPHFDQDGERVNYAPLLLDLRYCVTAYASDDFQSEILLGSAVTALHEMPVLSRQNVLAVLEQDGSETSLLHSGLAEQVERIRIRHRNLSEDTASRVWSAFQTPYRASAFYEVSVVIIQRKAASQASIPVLERRIFTQPNLLPVGPSLNAEETVSVVAGEQVTLRGLNLEGTARQLEGRSLLGDDPAPINLPDAADPVQEVAFQMPNTWPIGIYQVSLYADRNDGRGLRQSNSVTLRVLPDVTNYTIQRSPAPESLVTVIAQLSPSVQAGQIAELRVNDAGLAAPQLIANSNSVTFEGLDIEAQQDAVLRVSIDGLESRWIDRTTEPPSLLASAQEDIP